MTKVIDLRSDTVTEPTEKMREAMYQATVGDDVYEDDPTVKELEAFSAALSGKEAALFVPSGTFANQLAIFTHCKRGDEVILGEDCHIVAHEVGGAAVIAGVQLRPLETKFGKMNLNKIHSTIRMEEDIHFPDTGLICLENAYSNGVVVDQEYMQAVSDIAKATNIPVHLDGARLFNAAAYLNCDIKEMTQYADSVMFCLSKGLCAPVGSILAGNKSFIDQARKKRKLLGGGMRQVGFLAAAGLVALKEMTTRLRVDHSNALYLAEKLAHIPCIQVWNDYLHINMVFFQIDDCPLSSAELVEEFKMAGIKVNPPESGLMRFVTHYWISRTDIDHVVDVLKNVLTKNGTPA